MLLCGVASALAGWSDAAVCSFGRSACCARHYAVQEASGVHLHKLACRCTVIASAARFADAIFF